MKIHAYRAGLAVALSLGMPAAAAAQVPLDTAALPLSAAVERALAHFPSLAAARARSDEADAAAGEAVAARLPSLRLGASAARFEEPMVVSPIHGFIPGATPPFDDVLIQSTTTLSYTLFDGGARGARIRRARAQADAAEAIRSGTAQGLISRVVATYLGALSGRRVLGAHDRRLSALREEWANVRKRYDAGRAARVEILRVEAGIARAEAERVELAAALDVTERDLARLVGAGVAEMRAGRLVPVALADSALPPRDALEARALESSPAVEQARRESAAADAAVGIARGARWPELRLVGSYLTYADGDLENTGEWNGGVQLALPLFAGGAIAKGIDRAEAGRRAARERLRGAQIETAEAFDRAWSAVEEARARTASLGTAVARSAEVARIERLRLDTGAGTQVDYLAAEADLLAAEAAWVQARHRWIAARVELARVAGELTPDWIRTNLENTR